MKNILKKIATLSLITMLALGGTYQTTQAAELPYAGKTFALIGDSYTQVMNHYDWTRLENR